MSRLSRANSTLYNENNVDNAIAHGKNFIESGQDINRPSTRTFGKDLSNMDPNVAANAKKMGLKPSLAAAANKPISSRLRVFDNNKDSMISQTTAAIPPTNSADVPIAGRTRQKLSESEEDRVQERVQPVSTQMDTQMADLQLDDVDSEDTRDAQYMTVYILDICNYLRKSEMTYQPNITYMKIQTDINEKMRAILVDWLVEVHLKFKLLPETLFLTINLIDRFLEKRVVARQKLQLVGVTCMLIASKYEEIYAPEVRDFVYITDTAYKKDDILGMESAILNTLEFNLTVPSAFRFLERYAKVMRADERTMMLARYLLELPMTEYKMLKYPPSTMAAAALYLALKVLKKVAWTRGFEKHSQYTESAIRPCAKDLCFLLQNAEKSSLQAVRKKYSLAKHLEVAKIPLDV
eukprot:GILJ01002666.1.p1 GENE.GILJ01002666.1~~GILJ01002666.1.p1  ORF type:complete len:408 (-),score=84.02 GILJ01002666.1:227-1450(-)